jgi:hypothetical protein
MHHNLKQQTEILLNSENYHRISEALSVIHELFASVTGIRAGDITDDDIYLGSGKAISPIKAALCLLEPSRTVRFLRGVFHALRDLQERFPGQRINVLYAGTGPYSTLVFPLLPYFNPGEISLTLVDVNTHCLEAVRELYRTMGFEPFINSLVLADAAELDISALNIHLAISETMQNALKREPQVAIMKNIIPQLQQGGVFIPEEIRVDVCLTNTGDELAAFSNPGHVPQRLLLGEVYRVSADQLQAHDVTVSVPDDLSSYHLLQLFTYIKVYRSHQLDAYECSLTVPHKLSDAERLEASDLVFHYRQGAAPGFEWTVKPALSGSPSYPG